MSDQYSEDEELQRQRWAERRARMRREKERREKLNRIARKCVLYGGCALCVAVGLSIGIWLKHSLGGEKETPGGAAESFTASVEPSSEPSAGFTESSAEPSTDFREPSPELSADSAGLSPESQGPRDEKSDAKWQKTQNGYSVRMDKETAREDTAESSFIGHIDKAERAPEPESIASPPEVVDGRVTVGDVQFLAALEANAVPATVTARETDVLSDHALLIDLSTNEIVAWKNAQVTINPASMTKIMTILVAAEHVSDLDDKVTVTIEMTDYAYVNGSSIAGFEAGEVVTVRDLFYGTILPSGGEAAAALAEYVAGSQEAFVELMNDKLEELGLSDTAHFTNCVGLYDEDHYCRVSDMAMILKTAVEDDWCREVLSAHIYTTSATEQHPEGLTISNWFLRRIEDKETGGEVICAKTGYVDESRSCAASYFVSDSGVPYICVTAGAHSSWRCIYDHVAMYSLYAK